MDQNYRILTGDVSDQLANLPDNFFDAVLSDPPYGISFMGKEWDKGVPSAEVYGKLLRVLKPGAFGLHFGGTRMWHRLAVNMEDAGFELRDTVMWLYGSGFPKSHNISKALDKAAGAEREVVCFDIVAAKRTAAIGTAAYGDYKGQDGTVTAPATAAAKQWDGYGTALKPAVEPALLVQKPFQSGAYTYQALQFLTNQEALWLNSTAPTAQSNSTSSQATSDGANTAQWPAASSTNTPGDLSAATGMLLSASMVNTYLNTVSLWKRTLAAALNAMSTSTTETAISKTIDWKTLWFYLSQTTPESIARFASLTPGQVPCADTAGLFLNDAFTKLNDTLLLIARETATSSTHAQQKAACSTDWEPALLVQKPLDKTFANNALAHGCGGLNIDGCRVGCEIVSVHNAPAGSFAGGELGRGSDTTSYSYNMGRFPANLILDEEAGEALGDAQRFFYCAKVSAKERNAGLADFSDKVGGAMQGTADGTLLTGSGNERNNIHKNNHPTLKPIALTTYLAKLLLVPKRADGQPRRILVPFSGAGSEMIGALKAGWDEVWGIEISPEYVAIAAARIAHHVPEASPLDCQDLGDAA